MPLILDIRNYVHRLKGTLQQIWQKKKKRPLSEKCHVSPLFPVRLVNVKVKLKSLSRVRFFATP